MSFSPIGRGNDSCGDSAILFIPRPRQKLAAHIAFFRRFAACSGPKSKLWYTKMVDPQRGFRVAF